MYAGRIVEQAPIERLFEHPVHPYTKGLMAATVRRGQRGRPLVPIPGAPPNLAVLPPGCAFRPTLRARRRDLPIRSGLCSNSSTTITMPGATSP